MTVSSQLIFALVLTNTQTEKFLVTPGILMLRHLNLLCSILSHSLCPYLTPTLPLRHSNCLTASSKAATRKILCRIDLKSPQSLIDSMLASQTSVYGSESRSDVTNKTKYEKIFLWQFPLSRFLVKTRRVKKFTRKSFSKICRSESTVCCRSRHLGIKLKRTT